MTKGEVFRFCSLALDLRRETSLLRPRTRYSFIRAPDTVQLVVEPMKGAGKLPSHREIRQCHPSQAIS
jgi:hypothetical protein